MVAKRATTAFSQHSFHEMYGYRFRVTVFIRVQLKERKVVR